MYIRLQDHHSVVKQAEYDENGLKSMNLFCYYIFFSLNL